MSIDEKQHAVLKQALFDNFIGSYQSLLRLVHSFPIPMQLKQKITDKFDDGYVWTEKAFSFITLQPATEANDNVVPLETVTEDATVEETQASA